MSLTLEDIKTILEIIDRAEGREIHLEHGDLTLIVRRGGEAPPTDVAPVPAARSSALSAPQASGEGKPAADASAPETAAPGGNGAAGTAAPSPRAVPLASPLSGIIYRAPSPEESPFVEVGAAVGGEDTVCIIDVMKVMNLIKAPAAGKIVRIDVENGQSVQVGDAILWVEPA